MTARKVDTLAYLPDGPNVLKLRLNVASAENIHNCFTTAVEKFGRIEIVINSTGYALSGDTEAIAESVARLEMETIF
jgi:NADP-dependent 3-hydroxy acid dehydrogenase YdfG